jgi:hypothetical protein
MVPEYIVGARPVYCENTLGLPLLLRSSSNAVQGSTANRSIGW